MKQLKYIIEALLLSLLMLIFRILPLDAASNFAGWIGRTFGPKFGTSRKARENLKLALPDFTDEEHEQAIVGMWDNLARVMAEYPHLMKIGGERVALDVHPDVQALINDDKPCMMIAAHLANWEIAAAAMLSHYNKKLDLTYRAPNNPWVDKLLLNARSLRGQINCYAKSRKGGQEMIGAMRSGNYIAMLIDQKYNEGIAVPFFGHEAMTNPVFVQLAQKFDYPIVPARIKRTKGANFEISLHEPLNTLNRSTEEIIADAHTHLERWIKDTPEQWLWLHKRWDSAKLKEKE